MKVFVFLFPIALFSIFLGVKLVWPGTYLSLIQEDSVVEYSQALIYFLSSILSFIVSRRFLKNRLALHGILYGFLAIGLLLVSLEEISWGQRVFGMTNPVYFEKHNTQHEMSIHNLETVQPRLHKFYIMIGAYGAFAWVFAGLLLSKIKTKLRYIVDFVVPDWFVSSYFFCTFFVYTLIEYVARPHGGFLLWRDQEPSELLLALGFLSFVMANHRKSRIYAARFNSDVVEHASLRSLTPPVARRVVGRKD